MSDQYVTSAGASGFSKIAESKAAVEDARTMLLRECVTSAFWGTRRIALPKELRASKLIMKERALVADVPNNR